MKKEHTKSQLHEINTCHVGTNARVGVGTRNGDEMDGNLEEDLIYCLSMETMDRTLNLMLSETPATDKTSATI